MTGARSGFLLFSLWGRFFFSSKTADSINYHMLWFVVKISGALRFCLTASLIGPNFSVDTPKFLGYYGVVSGRAGNPKKAHTFVQ